MKSQEPGQNAAEKKAWDLAKQALRKMQLAHKSRAASGRDAWSEFERSALEDGNRKLSIDEAKELATRLHRTMVEHQPRLKALGGEQDRFVQGSLRGHRFEGALSNYPAPGYQA